MKMKTILQCVPIILSVGCALLWLIAQTSFGFSYGTTAYINLLIHVVSPIYMLTINAKQIGLLWLADFKVLILMYIVVKIALCIYLLGNYIFTSVDGMGWAIFKGVWIINSCILLIGWLIIKVIKSVQKR